MVRRAALRRDANSVRGSLPGRRPRPGPAYAPGASGMRGDPRFAWPPPGFWQFVGASVAIASFFLLWIVVLNLLR